MKILNVKVGDKLVADGGFTCLAEGSINTVCQKGNGPLFIRCKEGDHILLGQTDKDGNLVGLSLVP